MSSLVKWVEKEFLSPNSADTPSNDRMWMFAAVVDLITRGVRSHADYRIVHQIFTYLLRGWNPVTMSIKPSCYGKTAGDYFTDEYKALVKELMDFESVPRKGVGYALLINYVKNSVKGVYTQSEFEEEQKTLMLVALWLIKRPKTIVMPKNIILVRACMDLYCRHLHTPNRGEYEYIASGLGYMGWMTKWIDNILSSDLPFDQAVDAIIYLAMFACLIRAYRFALPVGTNDEYALGLLKTLQSKVAELKEYIDKYPLVASETKLAKGRQFNYFGRSFKRSQ